MTNAVQTADDQTSRLVSADNFDRAESDMYFASVVAHAGGLNILHHDREFMAIDDQTVIRSNRDTLYSSVVVDLDAGPVTVTLPDPGARFMSLLVINEDHYAIDTFYAPTSVTYSQADIGTRYVVFAVRTFVDPNDPEDLPRVHALQDAIVIDQPGGPGVLDLPAWDAASQATVRDALLILNSTLPDLRRAFGRKDAVDPVRHLIGAAAGWGGNPDQDAVYLTVTPPDNDGGTNYRITIPAEIPIDGFWSICVYNAAGYFEPNAQNAYSLNSQSAQPGADGTTVIHLGGCDDGVANCLPITPGWNYMVRLYRPHPEVVDGSWVFPAAEPVR